jgi:hypothetical protein
MPAHPPTELERELAGLVEGSVVPCADIWDRDEAMPREVIAGLARRGLFAGGLDAEHGGRGLDAGSLGLVAAELGRGSASLLSLYTVHAMVCQAVARWGSEPLRRQWLSRLGHGEALGAFALTEPESGSDAASVACSAVRDGDAWRLDGCKTWISGAQSADLVLVLARTDAGLACFLVELSLPGVRISPIHGMLGFRAAGVGTIEFDGCRIGDAALLARAGFGLSHVANQALDLGRFCIAWGATGLLQAVVEASVAYVTRRRQFGSALIDHQLIQRMIADMEVDLRAARLLCRAAADLRQARDPAGVMATNTAKYFAARAAVRAAADAVQVHGAAGLGPGLPVQRYYRDAKAFEVIEGSNQIQQILIAQDAAQRHARRPA